MRITALRIENFRSIKNLEIELADTSVFVGPNNAGKTAILEAVRIALMRRWGQRGTGFTEYDVHLATETDDPKASPGVAIELRAEETAAGEWPEGLHQALNDIEHDRRSPSEFVARQIAKGLEMDADYLIFLSGSVPKDILQKPVSEETVQEAFRVFRKKQG